MNIIIDFVVEILATNVWQLIGIMFGLLILKQVKADIRPIFLGMVGPLTKQAQSNAAAWAVGIMLGVMASLGSLKEVADSMRWVWVSNSCKVIGPGLATIVALMKQSPVPPTNGTTPPFVPSIPPNP